MELSLASDEAEKERKAAAAKREAAEAYRKLMEAKAAKSARGSRTSITPVQHASSTTPEVREGRYYHMSNMQPLPSSVPPLPINEDAGRGIWGWAFPDERRGPDRNVAHAPPMNDGVGSLANDGMDSHIEDRKRQDEEVEALQKRLAEHRNNKDEEINALRKRISELEKGQGNANNSPVNVSSGTSGYLTPRNIDAPLIDLSSPIKIPDGGQTKQDLLDDLPVIPSMPQRIAEPRRVA